MHDAVPDTTITALLNMAHQANAVFDYQTATRLARQALDSMESESATREAAAQAHSEYALAQYNQGRIHDAERNFDCALTLYDALDDQRHAVWCQIRIAWCSHERSDLPRSLHLASEALATARRHGWDDLEAKALVSTGNVAWKRGDRAAAIGDLTRAATMFERLGMVNAAQRARGTIGYVQTIDGNCNEGRRKMETALEYFRRAGDAVYVAKMMSNLAFVHFTQGELHEARDLLLQAGELSDEMGCIQPALSIWYNLGLIELHLSRRSEAKKCFIRAQSLAGQLDDPTTASMTLLYLGLLKIYEGRADEALEMFRLSAGNFAGSACDEAQLTTCYLAVGYLAAAHEEQACRCWEQRQPVAALRDCIDDFQIIAETLEFIGSADYRPPRPLAAETPALATGWRSQLLSEIKALD